MPKRTGDYDAWLLNELTDPEIAASYVNAAIAEDPDRLKVALGNVAKAHTMKQVAKEAGVARESLYTSYSEAGNPTLSNLNSVLKAVGLRIAVVADTDELKLPAATPVPTVEPLTNVINPDAAVAVDIFGCVTVGPHEVAMLGAGAFSQGWVTVSQGLTVHGAYYATWPWSYGTVLQQPEAIHVELQPTWKIDPAEVTVKFIPPPLPEPIMVPVGAVRDHLVTASPVRTANKFVYGEIDYPIGYLPALAGAPMEDADGGRVS